TPRAAAAFTLSPGVVVDRIRADGHEIHPVRAGDRHALALAGATAHEVVIEYHGTLDPAPATGQLTRSVGSPEGSCLLGAGWFPSFDGPFTYELTIDVPEPQRAVTSGRLAAETATGGRSRATFVSDAPVTELSLFAGPFRVAERIHRGWRLRTYFDAAVADLADRYLDRVQEDLDLYDGWIGTYPYSGFAVVSGPFPVGLGFPGLTYMGTQVLRLPFIPDTSLGHEVLTRGGGTACAPARAETGPRVSRRSWRTTRSSNGAAPRLLATSVWHGCARARSFLQTTTGRSLPSPPGPTRRRRRPATTRPPSSSSCCAIRSVPMRSPPACAGSGRRTASAPRGGPTWRRYSRPPPAFRSAPSSPSGYAARALPS